tara:strand:+ start:10 stop:612 length:603 start_codon:yes stop_codon:yes gene_type:complete
MGLISNGTTIFDLGATSAGIGSGMKFMKKLTASGSATLSFVHGSGGVDFSTHKEYMFTFNNIHPASDQDFEFQGSTDGGSSYGVTMTTTFFQAYHNEADSAAALGYSAGNDIAQGTGFQRLMKITTDNDFSCGGTLNLFNPSSTTFVKHFTSNCNGNNASYSQNEFSNGYFNTTSAIDAFQFKMASGNIDAGDICLYGIA